MNLSRLFITISAVLAVGTASASDYYQSILQSIQDYEVRIATLEAQIQATSGSERKDLRGQLRILERFLNNYEKELRTLERSFPAAQKAPAVTDDAGKVISPEIIEALILEKKVEIGALATEYIAAPKEDRNAIRSEIIGLFDEIRSLRRTLQDIKTVNISYGV